MTNYEIETMRRQITDATHLAVCEFTDSDGCGRCFDYALAGWYLATKLFRREYILQAGTLHIIADPPYGVVAFEPGKDGFYRGEFHCWFAAPPAGVKGKEFVDLSSRHYKRLVEEGPQLSEVIETEGASIMVRNMDRIQWTRKDEPPKYIWTDGMPDDSCVARLIATTDATNFFIQAVRERQGQYTPLIRLVQKHYQELAGKRQGVGRLMPIQSSPRRGRNAACPCGSGKKFKKCCLGRPSRSAASSEQAFNGRCGGGA